MVDADEYDVLAGEVGAVIEGQLAAGAHREAAAVQPHHHGALPAVVDAVGPDVEVQAVVGLRTVVPLIKEGLAVVLPGHSGGLVALMAVIECGLDAFPAVRVLRGHEAVRLGVLDALEGVDAVFDVAAQGAVGGLHQGVRAVDDEAVLRITVAGCKKQARGCDEQGQILFHMSW